MGCLAVIAIIILGIMITLPSLCRVSETANRAKCASNLSQIGKAIIIYANEHRGQYPSEFAVLAMNGDLVPEVFTCPSSNAERADWGATLESHRTPLTDPKHCSYVYCGDSLTTTASETDDEIILAYEPPTNHDNDGINILFVDGHVEFFVFKKSDPNGMIQRMMKDAEAGVRPVRLKP